MRASVPLLEASVAAKTSDELREADQAHVLTEVAWDREDDVTLRRIGQ